MGSIGNVSISREINFAKIFIWNIVEEPWRGCRTDGEGGMEHEGYIEKDKVASICYTERLSGNGTGSAEDKGRTCGRTTG